MIDPWPLSRPQTIVSRRTSCRNVAGGRFDTPCGISIRSKPQHLGRHRERNCSVVPIRRARFRLHIREMIQPRMARKFDFAHSVSHSIPWRCAFDCPTAADTLTGLASRSRTKVPYEQLELYKTNVPAYDPTFESPWPDWLFKKSTSELTKEDIDRIQSQIAEYTDAAGPDLPQDHASSDKPLYPARLLIVIKWSNPQRGIRDRARGQPLENATRHNLTPFPFQHAPNPKFRLIFSLEYALSPHQG